MDTLLDALRGRRVGVVLSAGYFGFFGHAGFVEGLLDAGVRPAAWAGSSAGALVAAHVAGGLAPAALLEALLATERSHFWDPAPVRGALDALRGGPGAMGLLSGRRFRALLERTLPVATFDACAVPLRIAVTDLRRGDGRILEAGPLAPAVQASCAYPGLFRPVRHEGALLWDGGLVDKAPVLALAGSGLALDALLVHWLPSREEAASAEPGGPLGYLRGISASMTAMRRNQSALQIALARARGLPVHVVTSRLPAVSPRALGAGRDAAAAGRAAALAALAAPAQDSLGADIDG